VADPRAEQLDFFIANVDAFQGHSGSATFDSENRLAGILRAGRTPDYVTLDGETCQRVSVYKDSQAAEVIHNIAPIVAALCDEGWDAEALCGPNACDGEPCGSVLPPPGGSGTVPSSTTACSASTASTGFMSGWLGLLLFAAVRRFRRRAA
jgi:hypothetical protein